MQRYLRKIKVKCRNFVFYKFYFFIIICWNSIYFLSNHSMTSSQLIPESSKILANYFPFSQLHVIGFQRQCFSNTRMFLHLHQHLPIFSHWFDLQFVSSNLYLHSHEICFVNLFDSCIPVIMVKTLRFKISVLFGTYNLLDKSLIVLQLSSHLSNLIENG